MYAIRSYYDDADAYAYSGSLCRANQGMMEFVRNNFV